MSTDYLKAAVRPDSLPLAFSGRRRANAVIKDRPEDFVVEEVNAFEPSGTGKHLLLWIEKRDCSGGYLLEQLAGALGIRTADIGYAGTKDRVAISRQWLSVPESCEDAVRAGPDMDCIAILRFTRNERKLRLGHLSGNRFSILLRGADRKLAEELAETGRLLESEGFPNFYGIQRFGRAGESLDQGLSLLADKGRTGPGRRGPTRFQRRMLVSAVQSALFNRYLLHRIEEGLDSKVLAGDVMKKSETGGMFTVERVSEEQARLDAGETLVTGPMFGHKMRAATDESAVLEQSILEGAGITADSFLAFGKLARGTRRPLFVRPTDFNVETDADGIVLTFFLPKGSYASVMLREFVLPG